MSKLILKPFTIFIDINSIEVDTAKTITHSLDYYRGKVSNISLRYRYIYPLIKCISCGKITSTEAERLTTCDDYQAAFICKYCNQITSLIGYQWVCETLVEALARKDKQDNLVKEIEAVINCK